jgi:SAM-dependent methyltransferase
LAQVSFAVSADAYMRFMGRYSEPLAVLFADLAGLTQGKSALDVGSGPGVLTAELVRRQGSELVSAVDPAETFVAAARERLPGVDIRQAAAEQLPFRDRSFDAALAQLVVHFMTDPVAGLREMGRVCRGGGIVAACVWDYAGGRAPLTLFWQAAHELDPAVVGESGLAGARQGHLAELCSLAGLGDVRETTLTVSVGFASFEDWWDPFTLGVGPAGAYLAGLPPEHRGELRERCQQHWPPAGAAAITASVWAATGRI